MRRKINNNRRLELCNFCLPENGKEIEDGKRKKYRKDKKLYGKRIVRSTFPLSRNVTILPERMHTRTN